MQLLAQSIPIKFTLKLEAALSAFYWKGEKKMSLITSDCSYYLQKKKKFVLSKS